ncbi:MAG: PLP-dependent cysteine synthase family protein [Dehalococcoidia bacterium]|nr:MAG: PLP-dependent cysteine synthase family protein [Dehalococcoidia bacterium]
MSIIDSIGNTPLVELTNINGNNRIRIMAKLEGANPGGSVKDRPAYYMLKKAIESGELNPGKIILEPTSGNTGIALAMLGAAMGYRVELTMPECVSIERQRAIEAFGAYIHLTPGDESTDGAIVQAHQMIQENPDRYFMPNQFDNENNVLSHYETTGPEIFEQTSGEVDVFVAGMGTTGTLMGVSRYLKEHRPSVKVIGIEPDLDHKIQGLKNMKESLVPGILKRQALDGELTVSDEEAFDTTRMLATREGLFVGMSSGAALAGALKVVQEMSSGTLVVLLPDRGDRYLSTCLFMSTCAKCPP